MTCTYSRHFTKKIQQCARKNPLLLHKARKTIKLFLSNPQHPSLKMHRLTGKLGDYYSIAVDRSIRIVLEKRKNNWILIDLGTHDEVYRQN